MIGSKLLLTIVLFLGLFANYIHLLGLFDQIKPHLILPIFLLFILVIFKKTLMSQWKTINTLNKPEKAILGIIFIQFTIYALGIFIPDTSFDAIWYHLPEAQVYAATGSIKPIPELIYSTMPRLGEMLFIPGFLIHSSLAVKFTSFILSILFVTLSYQLARLILTRFSALLTAAIVNSSFIIAWQSTTGYVDITRAVFELAALITLIKYQKHNHLRSLLLAAILLGFALSVKMQSAITLIAFLASLITIKQGQKNLFIFISTVIITASVWYLFNWYYSGHLFYPLNLIAKQSDQFAHAGASSLSDWLIHQTITLPRIIWDTSFNFSRLLTPIIILLLPLAWIGRGILFNKQLPLMIYTACYLIIWWYLPPPENRYLIGLLPAIISLLLYAVIHLPAKFKPIKTISFLSIIAIIFINLAIRTYLTYPRLPVVLGSRSSSDYIRTQTTDFNRSIIEKYYSGYWLNYTYSSN